MELLRRLFTRCPHESVRCVHGDEIVSVNFRRVRCLDCGRPLPGELPEWCFFTRRKHSPDFTD